MSESERFIYFFPRFKTDNSSSNFNILKSKASCVFSSLLILGFISFAFFAYSSRIFHFIITLIASTYCFLENYLGVFVVSAVKFRKDFGRRTLID